MPVPFFVLLDDGKLLPFEFTHGVLAAPGQVTVQAPVDLAIDPADGTAICLSIHVDKDDASLSRIYAITAAPLLEWATVHELKLDGTFIRKEVIRVSPRAGVTHCGRHGAMINAATGVFLWGAGFPLLLPLHPQEGRSIDATPQPGLWWEEKKYLFLPNARGGLTLYEAAEGETYELAPRRLEIDTIDAEGNDRHLGVVSIDMDEHEVLTIAWTSRLPIAGSGPRFATEIRRFRALELILAAKEGEPLDDRLPAAKLTIDGEQISGARYLEVTAAEVSHELFLAGIPKGRFRRLAFNQAVGPGGLWELKEDVNLDDLLTDPQTTENARFLHFGP